jgi:hypothetical protein
MTCCTRQQRAHQQRVPGVVHTGHLSAPGRAGFGGPPRRQKTSGSTSSA